MKEEIDLDIFTLSNGLRVVHKTTNRPVSHCAFIINAGTRDEKVDEHGIAHFIEHAIFKGTKNRKSYHILNRMDSVGGEIDAYTTKEITCFYSSFLSEYYDRAIELLNDILFHSEFPERELIKEKEVVIDEIKVYLDSPSDQIYDDFESQVFKGHELGNGILGTEESIRKLKREQLFTFTKRMYQPSNMVFASVGNISSKKLKRILEKRITISQSISSSSNKRSGYNSNLVQTIKVPKSTYQTHCIIGNTAYGLHDKKRIPFILLNNILGGPAMNSILNLKVREKYGYTYTIESNYATYSDSGLFSIYLAADQKYIDKSVQAVLRELKLLRDKRMSSSKIHQYKQQLKGQLALGRESNINILLSNAKSLLFKNRIDSIEAILSSIDSVSESDLLEVANEALDTNRLQYLYYTSTLK